MINKSKSIRFIFVFLFIVLQVSTSAQKITDTDDEPAKKDTSGVNYLVEKVMDVVTVRKEKYSLVSFPMMEYSKELGFAVGVLSAIVINDSNAISDAKYYRPTTIIPSFEYSTNNHLLFDADLILYTKNNWLIFSRLAAYNVPTRFYGIGTPQNNESKFNQDTYANIAAFLKSINNNNYLGLSYDIGHVINSEIKGETLNKDISGYDGGFHLGLGAKYQFDNRNDILYPSKGILFKLSFTPYFGDYSFSVSNIDFRNYTTLYSEKNIIANQFSWTVSSGDVPFYKLPKLGGKSNLRSINNSGKYINNHNYYFQTEYRRHLTGRFGATIFMGLGSSASGFNNEYTEDMVYEYGLGFRFRMLDKDKLNFRFDVGFGNGDPALFMTIREAF